MTRSTSAMIAFGAITLCLGCNCRRSPGPSTFGGGVDEPEYPPVQRSELRFADPLEGARFDGLSGCISGLTEGWSSFPMRKVGGSVIVDWCRGERAERGCSFPVFREQPGVEYFELMTTEVAGRWPEVRGVGLDAVRAETEQEWGVAVRYYENTHPYIGNGLQVVFSRPASGGAAHLSLQQRYAYDVGEDEAVHTAPGSGEEVLRRILESPEALTAEAEARYTALLAEVPVALETAEVCEYGPYPGGGLPRPCNRVPMPEADKAATLARARQEISVIRATFEQSAPELHELLRSLLDLDRCLLDVTVAGESDGAPPSAPAGDAGADVAPPPPQ